LASLVVVLMVIVTLPPESVPNVQLASEGRPAQENVMSLGTVVFAETVSVTVPDWPPTMLREVGEADTVSAV
jgi:hypothetical protein